MEKGKEEKVAHEGQGSAVGTSILNLTTHPWWLGTAIVGVKREVSRDNVRCCDILEDRVRELAHGCICRKPGCSWLAETQNLLKTRKSRDEGRVKSENTMRFGIMEWKWWLWRTACNTRARALAPCIGCSDFSLPASADFSIDIGGQCHCGNYSSISLVQFRVPHGVPMQRLSRLAIS